ncbi:MAG: hypothetical protein E5Y62_18855 [Mesorhizobium sp.]|nr:MAG: hypothetical protein E5Y62_18855 [Mesorhizobium sp.]
MAGAGTGAGLGFAGATGAGAAGAGLAGAGAGLPNAASMFHGVVSSWNLSSTETCRCLVCLFGPV